MITMNRSGLAIRHRQSSGLLLAFCLLLSACSAAPAASPTPTGTASQTASPTFTPTSSPTRTPTPEPAWYQLLDPSLGVLKSNYAEVINPDAKRFAYIEDALVDSPNHDHLVKFPAYVAYSSVEPVDGHEYYLTRFGWMNSADLQPLTPSTFGGVLLTREPPFRFGWLLAETHSTNAAGLPVASYRRYQVVHEVPAVIENPGYVAVGADEWLPGESGPG